MCQKLRHLYCLSLTGTVFNAFDLESQAPGFETHDGFQGAQDSGIPGIPGIIMAFYFCHGIPAKPGINSILSWHFFILMQKMFYITKLGSDHNIVSVASFFELKRIVGWLVSI